jgi:hypothetical protein
MKHLLTAIFIALTTTVSAQTNSESVVPFIGNIMIENLSGAYIIESPTHHDGTYLMQIKCSDRADFGDISFSWNIGVAREYSDVTIYRQWRKSEEGHYVLSFFVDGYDGSIYLLFYKPVERILIISHTKTKESWG